MIEANCVSAGKLLIVFFWLALSGNTIGYNGDGTTSPTQFVAVVQLESALLPPPSGTPSQTTTGIRVNDMSFPSPP
ncbi:MAG: hypothetical protein ACK5PZ_18875, partial [Pirellula sp.]